MFELFVVPILAIHLLSLNLASAGPVICMWLRCRKHLDEPFRGRVGQRLARSSLGGLVLGMLLGGVLLLPNNPPLHAALARFPVGAYWKAAGELAFSLLCLWAYAATWRRFPRRRILHGLLALLVATNLLYHFPPLMVVLAKLTGSGHWASEAVIERAMFLKLMLRSEVLAISMHFVVASFVVAAIATIYLAIKEQGDRLDDSADTNQAGAKTDSAGNRLAAQAALFAALCTALQVPVGIWILTTLPAKSRNAVMGENLLASICFAGGIATTLALLQQLMQIAVGGASLRAVRRSLWLLTLTVLLMIVTLRG